MLLVSHKKLIMINFSKLLILLLVLIVVPLSNCSEDNIGESDGVMMKILALKSSVPLFEVSYTSTVLTLINPAGPSTAQIDKMVERPIETKDLVKLTVWSADHYKIETERLEAEMPSFTVLEGLPNPDPVGNKIKWENGKMVLLKFGRRMES